MGFFKIKFANTCYLWTNNCEQKFKKIYLS